MRILRFTAPLVLLLVACGNNAVSDDETAPKATTAATSTTTSGATTTAPAAPTTAVPTTVAPTTAPPPKLTALPEAGPGNVWGSGCDGVPDTISADGWYFGALDSNIGPNGQFRGEPDELYFDLMCARVEPGAGAHGGVLVKFINSATQQRSVSIAGLEHNDIEYWCQGSKEGEHPERERLGLGPKDCRLSDLGGHFMGEIGWIKVEGSRLTLFTAQEGAVQVDDLNQGVRTEWSPEDCAGGPGNPIPEHQWTQRCAS